METVRKLNREYKLIALIAHLKPDHPALEYQHKGSHEYEAVMKWASKPGILQPVYENIYQTYTGIIYSKIRDAIVDIKMEYLYGLDINAVLNKAQVSSANKFIADGIDSIEVVFILESDFQGITDEAKKINAVSESFTIDKSCIYQYE
jgi:hypothetical protein